MKDLNTTNANEYIATKDWHNLVSVGQQLVNFDENSKEGWYYLALASYNLNEFDKASEFCTRAMLEAADDPKLFVLNGNIMLRRGDINEALAQGYHAYNLDQEYLDAYELIGNAQLELNNLEEAYRLFLLYQERYTDNPVVNNNLGVIESMAGMNDEAMEHFQKAILLEPNFSYAHCNLGIAYHKKGRVEESVSEFKKAITLDPTHSGSYVGYGRLLQSLGQIDLAIDNLAQAVSLDSNNLDALESIGSAFIDKNEPNNAVVFLTNAVNKSPDSFIANFNLGIAYFMLHEEPKAIIYLEKAHKLEPNNAKSAFYLGTCYSKINQLEKGLGILFESIALKDDLATLKALGITYYKLKDYEKSFECFNKLNQESLNENFNQLLDYLAKDREDLQEKIIYNKNPNGCTMPLSVIFESDISHEEKEKLLTSSLEKIALQKKYTIDFELKNTNKVYALGVSEKTFQKLKSILTEFDIEHIPKFDFTKSAREHAVELNTKAKFLIFDDSITSQDFYEVGILRPCQYNLSIMTNNYDSNAILIDKNFENINKLCSYIKNQGEDGQQLNVI